MKQLILSIAVAVAAHAGTNTWTPLGPYGGFVTTLAVDSRNPGTLYAASNTTAGDGGRLFKTTDGGASWTRLNTPFGAASIAVDPQNSNTVYIGLRGSSAGAWVFKSTDGGANFSLANSGLEAVQFYGPLAVDPMNPGTVYAAMIVYLSDPCRTTKNCFGTQVFKTTDGGASWSAVIAGLPQTDSLITGLAVDPQDSRILYAGLYSPNGATSGIFKSTNAGASWSAINSSVKVCCTYFSQGLVIDPLNHDTLYAASFDGIVKLSSAGAILSATPLGGGNITSLAIDKGTPYAAAAGVGSSSIFKSTDGGITWAAAAFPPQGNADFFALAVDQSSDTVYVGSTSGYGVFKTTDSGADWTQATYGLGPFNVRSVTVDPHNSGTLYALSNYPQGVFKTIDKGGNWAAVPGLQSPASLLIDPRDSNTLYAVTNNAILKSADAGATWNEAGGPSWMAAGAALGPNGRYTFPGALVLDPQNPDTLYALANGLPGCCRTDVFKSTNGGISWSMTASLEGLEGSVTLLSIDPRNSSTLYAAGLYVSKSTDGGVTWIASTLPPEAFPTDDDDDWAVVTSLAVDPQNSNVVYATGSGGIFKSTDGGASWTTMNSGLAPYACIGSDNCPWEPYLVASLVIDPQKSTLYAASRGGILRSTDGGSSWIQVNAAGLAGANSLALDPSNPSTLYGAAGGVYTITFAP